MQSLSACLVVAALLVAAPVNAQFQINTPASVAQCEATRFTWTGGQAPYFLAINPGAGVPGATAFQQFSGIMGTSIALELTDVNGEIAESAPVTIQSGVSNSCLNSAQSSASGPSETSTAGSTDTGKSTSTQSSTSITADTSTSNNAGAPSRTGDGTSAGSAPHTPGTSTTTDPTASATFIGISNSSIAPMPTVSAQSTGQAESRVSTGTVAAIATGIGAVAVLLATAASLLYIKRRRNRGPAAHAQPFTGASRSSADRGGGDDRGGPGMDDEDVVTRATSSLMARVSSVGDSSSAQDRVGRLPRSHRENISGGITASEKHLREFTQLRKGRNRDVTTPGERNVNGQPETHAAAMFEDPVSIGHGVERRRHPRHETDGGVRLEGGRPGEVVVDDLDQSDSMSEGSGTLPPPYASHFGDV